MSFTGERYIPGQGGCQLAYEHLHRYLFALRWAAEEQVLDLACGNGYGAAILARRARHVWALDIDRDTVDGANREWRAENLSFIQGDAARLPFRSGSLGLVVAFEALEHITDQELLLQEIARVCGNDGVALISTPNKAVYSDAREYANPFHVRELYLDEFAGLLGNHFRFVEIVGQQIRAGSLVSHNKEEPSGEVIVETPPGAEGALTQPMYYLALCSTKKIPKPIPAYSAYLDPTDGLVFESKKETDRLNQEIERLGQWANGLKGTIEERDQTLRALQARAKMEIDLRDQNIRITQQSLQNQIELRDRNIQKLQEEIRLEIAARDQRITDLLKLLHQKEKEFDERGAWALSLQAEVERLESIRRTLTYKILSRLGLLPR